MCGVTGGERRASSFSRRSAPSPRVTPHLSFFCGFLSECCRQPAQRTHARKGTRKISSIDAMYKAYTRRNVGKTKRHEEGGDSTDLRLWRTRRQTTQGRRRGGDRSSSLAPSGRSTRAKNSVEPAGRRPCCDAPSTPQSYGSRLPRRAMADHTRTRASRSTNCGRCLRDN